MAVIDIAVAAIGIVVAVKHPFKVPLHYIKTPLRCIKIPLCYINIALRCIKAPLRDVIGA